jgi:ribose transport system substrate-binding protein
LPRNHRAWTTIAAALIATTATTLSGCSSTSAGTSPGTSASTATTAATNSATTSSPVADPRGITQAARDEAATNLAPYTGHPNAFPVDVPLAKKPPAGTELAFLQCSDPICALFAQLIVPAAQAMGVHVTVTKGGASAQSLQQAMDSIIAEKPAAVLLPAVDPVAFRSEMDRLTSMGIPVISQGIADTSGFSAIKGVIFGAAADTLAGKLLADWLVSHNGAEPSVFYSTSALTFNSYLENGFKTEMAALCPSCQVRYVEVPVTTIGNTAPTLVTNDLRAHPETQTAVFATEEAADGLPAALKVAGINKDIIGFAPDPEVLGYIKAGTITAGLGYDALTSTWTQIDEAARILSGQGLTPSESSDAVVFQMLQQKDVTFDPTKGFTGYLDGPQRFATLWSGS